MRNEMFLALGYYVTESSGHNSEYNAWFRKRPDLHRKVLPAAAPAGTRASMPTSSMNTRRARGNHLEEGNRQVVRRTAWISRADRNTPRTSSTPSLATAKLFKFNGNVRNFGLVDNLPVWLLRGSAGAGLQARPGAHPRGQDCRRSSRCSSCTQRPDRGNGRAKARSRATGR